MADVYMLFADGLAQAIADGRKTVTRRPITKANSLVDGYPWTRCPGYWEAMDWTDVVVDGVGSEAESGGYLKVARPTQDPEDHYRHRVYCRHNPADTLIVRECWRPAQAEGRAWYRAVCDPDGEHHRWRPSIHMPRWAARSVRKILSITPDLVGPEPLSQEEAEREGFASPEAFAETWVSIYGPKPVWTWRYEFEAANG